MMNQATRDSIEGLGNPKILPKSGTPCRDGVAIFQTSSSSYGFFGSSNLTANPYAVSMIQTASHLSPDAVGNIQTASLEHGLESSSIFIPVSYLVHFLPKLSPNHVHDREQDDQDDNDLAKERDLLAL
ncbi:hypothetical protein Tco_1561911 [Tanacetum coccineum]